MSGTHALNYSIYTTRLYIFQEPFPIVFLSKSGESAGFSYFVGGWQRNGPHYYSVKNRNGSGIHTLVKLLQDLRSCYGRGRGRGFTRSAPGLSVMLFQGPTTAGPTQIETIAGEIQQRCRTATGTGIGPGNTVHIAGILAAGPVTLITHPKGPE